jgi:hypothetical protein
MMKKENYWYLFEKTGNINHYLNYACTSEESLKENRIPKYSSRKTHGGREHVEEFGANLSEEGGHSDESGNHHRNGSVGYADW